MCATPRKQDDAQPDLNARTDTERAMRGLILVAVGAASLAAGGFIALRRAHVERARSGRVTVPNGHRRLCRLPWAERLFAAGVVVVGLAASASARAGLPRPVPKLGPFEIDHQCHELTDTSYPQKEWK